MRGVILYYELAEPIEYPLPKVANNYTSSDYGVEQFDGAVPCNANNLYYMRSLAGETRNFLDRMYANTGKESSKDVADYITSGIEGNKANAEETPNLALRALFVAAGAEYNDTDQIIQKTAPWGDSVQHLPKHYYLNGLGDITEEQMMEIYRYKDTMLAIATGHTDRIMRLCQYDNPLLKTLFNNVPSQRIWENKTIGSYYLFGNKYLEVLSFQTREQTPWRGYIPIMGTETFYNCENLKAIVPVIVCDTRWNLGVLPKLEHIRFKVSKSVSINAPIISKDSILYTIQNATPTSAITITLHADAYARLADDADIVAALEAQPLITLVSA